MSNVEKSTFRVYSTTFKPLQCFQDNLVEMITILTPLVENNNQVTTLKVRVTLKGPMQKHLFFMSAL
jgi:hypothetical protein